MNIRTLLLSTIILMLISSCASNKEDSYKNWNVYGGTKDALHYSSLKEIDTNNVTQLKVAWVYHTGDADTSIHTQIQCNPIIVDSIMYAISAKLKLLALNAATGKAKWIFDPVIALATDSLPSSKLAAVFSNACPKMATPTSSSTSCTTGMMMVPTPFCAAFGAVCRQVAGW